MPGPGPGHESRSLWQGQVWEGHTVPLQNCDCASPGSPDCYHLYSNESRTHGYRAARRRHGASASDPGRRRSDPLPGPLAPSRARTVTVPRTVRWVCDSRLSPGAGGPGPVTSLGRRRGPAPRGADSMISDSQSESQ